MLFQQDGQARCVPNGRVREMNRANGVSSMVSGSVASATEGSEKLSRLAAAPHEQQKQILGERLYPLVHKQKVILVYVYCWFFMYYQNCQFAKCLKWKFIHEMMSRFFFTVLTIIFQQR